ncbi:MAG: L-glutamate gamma-semialdehyde dehydrogenase [Halarsenatibacteraceae bacterium]
MSNRILDLKRPENELVYNYEPGSKERKEVKQQLKKMKEEFLDIPVVIGGKEIKTDNTAEIKCPHDHSTVLGQYHKADQELVEQAIENSLEAKEKWARMDWEDRVAIFDRAAALLAGPWRAKINAATMLSQSKNVFQAEIDAACELIDFFRFNNYYLSQIYQDQPASSETELNKLEYRPLEGFVFAVPPFNFTSIGGNLPSAPAVCGNTVIWKPASTAVYSNYLVFKLLEEAGLPAGVINFIPGSGREIGPEVISDSRLAGIHFTGSTATFQYMWEEVGKNIKKYNSYPRIVGETGGKDFVFAHKSADSQALITALVRGAFEYQGQKCSAASRAYIPHELWDEISEDLIQQVEDLKVGPVEDFTNFINAVIDHTAFKDITEYIDHARESSQAKILAGGDYDDSNGFYIDPTIVLAEEPDYKSMKEEIFGPVLTIYLYDSEEYEETLRLCDKTSPYALTGAIFSKDREATVKAREILVQAAGNFYINDKPTGAVVGRQPFGGARASGTNDKAGSKLNLYRWISPRTIKENLVPPRDYSYPFMEDK